VKDQKKMTVADLYQRAFESALSVGSPDESLEDWAARLEHAMQLRRIASQAEILEFWTTRNFDN
jgi:hypothetical protein